LFIDKRAAELIDDCLSTINKFGGCGDRKRFLAKHI